MTTTETRPFQAEAAELLSLVVHSLYRNREVFLRELVSNASDALDKRRLEGLRDPALANSAEGEIRIAVDRERRTITIEDDGIGMNHDELVSNLGTIARSGTRAFLDKLRAAGDAAPSLIGQFGVGFYASFLVADEVTVDSRRAGTGESWRWRSDGKGAYTIETGQRANVGTTVTLHLRAKQGEDDEDPADFLEIDAIRDVVKRWSDFVEHPIRAEYDEEVGDKLEHRSETLNSRRPLWVRAKEEIRREEYDAFYRNLAHDWTPPAEVVHFKAEGTTEYVALLFVPGQRPMDLFDGSQGRSKIALYVRRVLILDECQDLLPSWLRFVRGIVDAPDLPLNVSREVLQQNALVRQIGKRLVKRVLESLATMLDKEREKYAKVWADFGIVLKEGIYLGGDEDGRISKIALFETTHGSDSSQGSVPTTLAEYVARKKPDQKAIWFLAGSERRILEASPHLEAMRRRGEEVLFFTDPIDEWVVERLQSFEGLPLKRIDSGDLDLETSAEKEAREKLDRDHREALQAVETRLSADVKAARFSTRLTESPAVLVSEGGAVSANMERILRAARQEVPKEKRVLELNPDHGLVKKLLELHAADPRSERVGDLVELLHGQALLAEGSPLPDPARFSKLLARLYA
ncbi:MAG: molecular chaperone HtpG [Planctomycetota bacterium]|nr:molecular chaperone HtpG [Planctomycetota bacterium]